MFRSFVSFQKVEQFICFVVLIQLDNYIAKLN